MKDYDVNPADWDEQGNPRAPQSQLKHQPHLNLAVSFSLHYSFAEVCKGILEGSQSKYVSLVLVHILLTF